VRGSVPGSESESESESGGGGIFDGGVLGGFGQGQLLDGNLMERVIKMLQGEATVQAWCRAGVA